MPDVAFAFAFAAGEAEREAVLLVESVRAFGGRLADSQVRALLPASVAISDETLAALASLNADVHRFEVDADALNFPFAAKVYAAAEAERLAVQDSSLLVWTDRGALFLQEPSALLLAPNKALGYRPVDHTVIGSPFDAPLDPFWSLIYERCHVPAAHVFPMTASVDRRVLRPYFNAGMLVVDPRRGLLQRWRDDFDRLYRLPEFRSFYEQDARYAIFVHQAVLAGTVLAALRPDELLELPPLVNYPLHMHRDYPADLRPERLNDVVSVRYEELLRDGTWQDVIRVDEPLKGWLLDRQGRKQPLAVPAA